MSSFPLGGCSLAQETVIATQPTSSSALTSLSGITASAQSSSTVDNPLTTKIPYNTVIEYKHNGESNCCCRNSVKEMPKLSANDLQQKYLYELYVNDYLTGANNNNNNNEITSKALLPTDTNLSNHCCFETNNQSQQWSYYRLQHHHSNQQHNFNDVITTTATITTTTTTNTRSNSCGRSVLPNIDNNAVAERNYAPISDTLLLALRRSQPQTRLFRALFQYIPLRDSPNENPQLELALQAGDYVLVHGHMDEDQFYFGETLTGRTGLVPSNYVERVPDYLLLQNAARTPTAQITSLDSSVNDTGDDSGTNNSLNRFTLPSTSATIRCNSLATRNSLLVNRRISPSTKSVATQSPPIRVSPLTITDDSTNIVENNCADGGYYDGTYVLTNLPSTSTAASVFGNYSTSSAAITTSDYFNDSFHPQQQGKNSRANSPSFVLNVPMHHAQITHDFTDFCQLNTLNNHNINNNNNNNDSNNNNNNKTLFNNNNSNNKTIIGVNTSISDDCSMLPDSVCPYPPVDVSKVTVQEVKQSDQPRVYFPRELCIEKRLSRSVLISWLPADDQLGSVTQYHVCVDGAVKAVVPGLYKCKALIEDLNLENSINISVRAITENGHSPDAACTIAVGADAQVAPQHVRVTNITPISAQISWYPSDSNAEHVLLLNAIKIGVCPGSSSVFQVQLQGLSPSTIYRVSVRTKHPKAVLEKRPVERCVDFKTLPKSLPDPPSNVQVEIGPQPGTLLISWKPVTNQPKPPSRAAVHSYLVFADGRSIAQVQSASADHVLLRLSDFADDPPIFITVRTRTREGSVSSDSNVVRVPRGTSSNLLNTNLPSLNQTVSASGGDSIICSGGSGAVGSSSLTNSLIGNLGTATTFDIQQQQQQQMHSLHQLSSEILQPKIQQQQQQQQSQQQNLLTTSNIINRQPLTQIGASNIASDTLVNSTMNLLNMAGYNVTPQQQQQAAAAAAAAAAVLASQQQQNAPPIIYQPQQQQLSSILGGGTVNATTQPLNVYTGTQQHQQQDQSCHRSRAFLSNSDINDSLWKQQSQTSQYYTFHPKSLYKEFCATDDLKPSVLELENNYFIKHQQQHANNRVITGYNLPYESTSRMSSTLARGTTTSNYYALQQQQQQQQQQQFNQRQNYAPSSTGVNGLNAPPYLARNLPSTAGRNAQWINSAQRSTTNASTGIPLPLSLSRVRSEEVLDTRSEPDLRPLALAQYNHSPHNPDIPYYGEESGSATRWFVALYDYDHHMSPNRNAQQEELSFCKHQLIKVYGDVDRDGFYYGEIGRRFGLVPSNMVIEIAKDDLQLSERRRSEIYPALDPVIRRMRWGSLKSRSYDNPGDRRDRHTVPRFYKNSSGEPSTQPQSEQYRDYSAYSSSLDRRERSMPPPNSARYYHEAPPNDATNGKYYGEPPHSARNPNTRSINSYGPMRAGPPRDLSVSRRLSYEAPADFYDNRNVRTGPTTKRLDRDYYNTNGQRDPYYLKGSAPSEQHDQYPVQDVREAPLRDTRQPTRHSGVEYGPIVTNGNGPIVNDIEKNNASKYECDDSFRGAGGGAPNRIRSQQPPDYDARDARYAVNDNTYTPQYGTGTYTQQHQQEANMIRHPITNMDPIASVATKKMIAKYDYNSSELSPNADAEVELSFCQGDIITVFGEMDEDGFYMGELNGVRGLVPSNFLQTPQGSTQSANTLTASNANSQVRTKGVMFSGDALNKRIPSVRQPNPNSIGTKTNTGLSGAFSTPTSSSSTKPNKVTGSGGALPKTLTKKTSDLTSKSLSSSNTAAAPKKLLGSKKVDNNLTGKVSF